MQEIQRHIGNIEREIAKLKELIGRPKEDESQQAELVRLRRQLVEEGLDEELIRLVGTLPIRNEDYKEEIRQAISARRQNQS